MRVLYAYRYGIVGGVSTQLLLRQDALASAGHEATLFFSQDNGLGQFISSARSVIFGSNTGFGKVVRQGNYDAVVVIDSPELIARASGGLFNRNPVFLDVHTTTDTGLSYLHDLDVSRLSGVMVPTAYSANLVRERVGKAVDVDVVPNILNSSVFHPRVELAVDSNLPVPEFIWVGKLDNHKNWRLALVYAGMLKNMLGRIRLNVVGGYTASEKRADEFFELAGRLDILDSVSWLDRVENTSLAAIYKRCALSGGAMLVTSRDESFGMAAAESLMCGCPLVANDLPVFREVFPQSDLVKLIDIWDPRQVAAAVDSLPRGTMRLKLVENVYQELGQRYGNGAFVAAFSEAIREPTDS